ncbi:uncharacterized protein LOC141678926 [Apium graveolens]|uniref:uncharacterized protein LOC141678926 n=1 Tax=Apium graveolens TaxID=4045 RepID=UPI003D7998D1
MGEQDDAHNAENGPLFNQVFEQLENALIGHVEVNAQEGQGPMQLGANQAHADQGANQVFQNLGEELMAEEDVQNVNFENGPMFNQIFHDFEQALQEQVPLVQNQLEVPVVVGEVAGAQGNVEHGPLHQADNANANHQEDPPLHQPVQILVFINGEVVGAHDHSEDVDSYVLGVQHLMNVADDQLREVMEDNNLELTVFNGEGMSLFERLIRALVEQGGSPANRPHVYQKLVNACNNQVTPATVAALGDGVLVYDVKVGGREKAECIRNFAQSFQNANELEQLTALGSEAIYDRLKSIRLLGVLRAMYVLVFGMKRLDFMPRDSKLSNKLTRLYGDQFPDYETWNPYQGLGAYIIWKYVSE